MEDARERGIPFRMWGVTQETLEEFEACSRASLTTFLCATISTIFTALRI